MPWDWSEWPSRPRGLLGEALVLSATARAPREGLVSLCSRWGGGSSALFSQGVGVPGTEATWCQHLDPSPGGHSSSPSGSGPLGAGEGLGYWEEHPQPPWSGAADPALSLTPFSPAGAGVCP